MRILMKQTVRVTKGGGTTEYRAGDYYIVNDDVAAQWIGEEKAEAQGSDPDQGGTSRFGDDEGGD